MYRRTVAPLLAIMVAVSACVDVSPPWAGSSAENNVDAGRASGGSGGGIIDAAEPGGIPDVPTGAGGGAISAGGAMNAGGAMATGGTSGSPSASGGFEVATSTAAGSGGIIATGGMPRSGGVVGSGGTVPVGGTAATGGVAAIDGAVATWDASSGCGTTKSDLRETLTFSFGPGVAPLTAPTTTLSGATTFSFSTAGPSSNPDLCSKGCAVLSVHFAEDVPANQASAAQRMFSAPVSLVGATVSFRYAIDNPAQVPVRLQVYATSDASAGWKWAAPTTVDGEALTAYSAATGFASETLSPRDDPYGYCASATKIVGLQVQNTVAITSATAGTVTIYIDSLAITSPP